MDLVAPLLDQLNSLTWRDYTEILCFSSLLYYVALWLRQDRTKNVLIAFYSYCAVWAVASIVGLSTITQFLYIYSPLLLTLLVIVHQQTLQKNLVALHKIQPATKVGPSDWLELLIRTMLITINREQTITCIIERTDALAGLVQAPFMINAPLNHDLLTMVLTADSFNEHKMVWLTHTAELVAINCEWNHALEQPVHNGTRNSVAWQEDALLFTAKTDAVVVQADAHARTFNLIANGTHTQQLSASHLRTKLEALFQSSDQKGGYHAAHSHKQSSDRLAH